MNSKMSFGIIDRVAVLLSMVANKMNHEIFQLWFQVFETEPPVVSLCAKQAERLDGYKLTRLALSGCDVPLVKMVN